MLAWILSWPALVDQWVERHFAELEIVGSNPFRAAHDQLFKNN